MSSEQAVDPTSKPRGYIKYTPGGEVFCEEIDGKVVERPTEDKPFVGIPAKFKPKHMDAMLRLHLAVEQIKGMKNRQVPLTRKEAMGPGLGIDKHTIKDLVGFGFVKDMVLTMTSRTGKRTSGMACVFFTPQGNAYCREKFKNETPAQEG